MSSKSMSKSAKPKRKTTPKKVVLAPSQRLSSRPPSSLSSNPEHKYPVHGDRAGSLLQSMKSMKVATSAALAAWALAGSTPGKVPAAHSVVGVAREPLFSDSLSSTGDSIGVAMSDTVKRYMHFAGSDKGNRIGMRQPLCHIGAPSDAATILGTFACPALLMTGSINGSTTTKMLGWNVIGINPLRAGAYRQLSSTTFNAGLAFWDSVSQSDMALAFSRWRVIGNIRFHYEAIGSSNTGTRLEFAYTEDAAQPRLGLSNAGAAAPGVATISSTPYSMSFAPWQSWSMTVPADNSWKYMYADPTNWYKSLSVSLGFDAPSVRDVHAGAITCAIWGGAETSAVTANQIYGRILVEYEIEYTDPAPINSLYINLQHLRALHATYDEVEGKEYALLAREDRKHESDSKDFVHVQEDPPPTTAHPLPTSSAAASALSPLPLTRMTSVMSPRR